MCSIFKNVLSAEDIQYLNNLPEAKSCPSAPFFVELTDSIRTALAPIGLDLSEVSKIPLRWIQGDTAAHTDSGSAPFTKTFLVYLSDSTGEFILGGDSYPITANTAFVFNEGLSHKTVGTEPRLLIGPMSEIADPVGNPFALEYYASESDALNYLNPIGNSAVSYTLDTVGGFSNWRIASNSTGTSSQSISYGAGTTLDEVGTYYLYPNTICFLEGAKILCQVAGEDTYLPVESMKVGTLVKTSRDGYKAVAHIGKTEIHNPGDNQRVQNRLFKCAPSDYPELKDDLYITGCHSILVDRMSDFQKETTKQVLGKIYVTDKKYRLMAYLDERAKPWESEGTYTIWHFALENTDIFMNYGVWSNGLLVETTSINFMKNWSNMKVV